MAYDEQDHVDGWQTYSNWIDNIRNNSDVIFKYDEDPQFKKKLMSCESNLARFELIWDDVHLKNELEKVYRDDSESCQKLLLARIGKSTEESNRLRQLGNKLYKSEDCEAALHYYTEAVKFAPYPSQDNHDESLALALANRSATLYALRRYRLCLFDIDLAVKYGYPEANLWKLLVRKVKCLHILSVWTNDVEHIKDDLRNMLSKKDTKEFIKTEISTMFEFIETNPPKDMKQDELDVVDETTMKISNSSKTLTQAADCIEMSYEGPKGRYLITNKDVSFGRLLVAEDPFVCNLSPAKRELYCYNCFARLNSCGIGCKECVQVLYCSEDCLNNKAQTHAYECNKFLDFQNKVGVAYLVTHIMFRIDFDVNTIQIQTKKTVDTKTLNDVLKIPSNDWPDLVYKNDYAAVLSLLDHAQDYDYDELMSYCLTAVYMMIAFLDKFHITKDKLGDENNVKITGSIVLKHLMQLQTNLISILDQNLHTLTSVGHTLSELAEHPIGVGIYPTICLLNHSCSPNIISIFHRNKFICRAASGLDCGTELNYCYGPSVNRMSKKDRQTRLKDQYFFTCCCDSCVNHKENESRALLCSSCDGPVIYNNDFTHICLQCKKENHLNVQEYLAKVKSKSDTLAIISTQNLEPETKIEKLKTIEKDLTKILYWRHPLFAKIKSYLVDTAQELEDKSETLKYCHEELNLCSKTYGNDSYESIMARLKVINLTWEDLYYTSEESQTSEAKQEALDQLKTLLSTITETRGKLRELLASTNIIGAESSFEEELKFLSEVQTSINEYLKSQQTSDSTSETNTSKTEDSKAK